MRAVDSPGSAAGGCAAAAFGTNTILLGRGTYSLQSPNGQLEITPPVTNLTITGAGEGNTVIDVGDAGHNLSFGGAGCPVTFSSGDPNLGPLQDNGGPTETIALGAGSAAIDQIPAVAGGCPGRDQRGVWRPAPLDGACDIGAYEVAVPAVTIQAIDVRSAHSVAIHASVNPNSGSGSVVAEYGRSRSLGAQTAARAIGDAPVALSFTLNGLDLRRDTYYIRLVATTPDGVTKTVELKLVVPFLGSLRVKPSAFRSTGRNPGATLTYTDTRKGFTRFDVQRLSGNGWVRMGSFGHGDRPGRNTIHWLGRLAGRRLGPGRYRLVAVPRASQLTTGPTITVGFTVRG